MNANLEIIAFQFHYMTHSPLRVGEGFLDALINNIRIMCWPDKLEIQFIALAIVARGSQPAHRRDLCCRALDGLEILGSEIAQKTAISGEGR